MRVALSTTPNRLAHRQSHRAAFEHKEFPVVGLTAETRFTLYHRDDLFRHVSAHYRMLFANNDRSSGVIRRAIEDLPHCFLVSENLTE